MLIIDEAYSLYSGFTEGGVRNGASAYKSAVIDTIVAHVQGVPGDDQCVLPLGYRDKMEEMFLRGNSGLKRQFQLEDAFYFESFSNSELQQILELKLQVKGMGATALPSLLLSTS